MVEYIKKSIKKFKDDSFSKVIYDILKGLLILLVTTVATRFFPDEYVLKNFMISKIALSVFQLIIICFSIIIVSIIVVFLIFRLKYNKIQSNYFTDSLTGLKNHLAMKKHIDEKISESKKNDSKFSLILIDIDNFKSINEKIGFNLADSVLKKVGNVLGNDKRYTDEVFRYFQRGDEFLILLKETSLDGALKAAKRKKELISKINFDLQDFTHQLTVCCGVTEFHKENDNYELLTERLNKALLEAKKQPNKNSVRSII